MCSKCAYEPEGVRPDWGSCCDDMRVPPGAAWAPAIHTAGRQAIPGHVGAKAQV